MSQRAVRAPAILKRTALFAALSVAGTGIATLPAHAQFFAPWFGGWRGPPVYRDAVIPPRVVAGIVHAQGFRLTSYPVRRGDRIIAVGVDGRGQSARFVIDAYDGALIRTALVGPPPSGYVGNGRDTYAYGAPAEPERPLSPAVPSKPKPKPKVKTAAKPPSVIPGAAPASPVPTPSTATQSPAPLAPPAAPVAVTPPTTQPSAAQPQEKPTATITPAPLPAPVTAPAPPTPVVVSAPPPTVRPAPDAQPADVGPRVVPVKPTEARGPDVPPPAADWDTEAAPKVVTPAEANTMAPERVEDR